MAWEFDDSGGKFFATKLSRWHDDGVPYVYSFERVRNGGVEVWINHSAGELVVGGENTFNSFTEVCEYVGEVEAME